MKSEHVSGGHRREYDIQTVITEPSGKYIRGIIKPMEDESESDEIKYRSCFARKLSKK